MYIDDSILLLVERNKETDEVSISSNATFMELHGIIINLVQSLADHAGVSYNKMLADFLDVTANVDNILDAVEKDLKEEK